ncbi:LrgB family protein [Sporosarcina sp. JAI121]|uniref:LrgB family protein n=1 Tax=Sporosarcina sp. JAI121 TaxID=2723064 RepID=UPI0015CDAA21|nr:LrgB family protein [Sporosarcina sp. JAI121]NYF24910.1 putative murein hydrolase (TIGR00659 family) [Sporosarcina sp. JAI121]
MRILMVSILFFMVTIATYLVMNFMHFKYRKAFLLPILTTTVGIILVLVVFKVPYETYMLGGKWVDLFLGPAIVALAIPLYKQRELIKQNMLAILVGVVLGVFVGMTSGILFTNLVGFSEEIIYSILPKSITTPIAIQISASLGGITSLTIAFVMIAGFTGIIIGPMFMKWLRIDTTIGRGIGLGAAAHALGTSKAIEYGEEEASYSSIAMTLSALIGSIVGPVMAWILL